MPDPSAVSLSETDRKRIKARSVCRRQLGVILKTICSANTNHLDPSICEEAGVVQQILSLDDNSDYAPTYFNRYQVPFNDDMGDIPEEDDEIAFYSPESEPGCNVIGLRLLLEVHINWHGYNTDPVGSYFTSWDRLRCGDLFETDFDWQASLVALSLTNPETWPCVAEGPIPPLPHVKCLMYTGVIGDDRLLRSEIKAIVKLMSGRLFVKSVRAHMVAPVMLFSIMGPWHVRILEAHFDGRKLIVRNTPLYDLRDKVTSKTHIENLCYWWHGNSIGNTTELENGPTLT